MKELKASVLFVLLIISQACFGQQNNVNAISIGEEIPEAIWLHPMQVINHPRGKRIMTLNELRNNRLIILNFWGSNCPPCIRAVDKLDSLKSQFRGQLGALSVLTHSKVNGSVLEFMKRRKWTLPSVVNDSLLDQQVFNKYLTAWGEVWILDGRLLAVPRHGYLNANTIKLVLQGSKINFVNMNHVPDIRTRQPIFVTGNGNSGVWYKSAYASIGRYMPDYPPAKLSYEQFNDTTILYTWNQPLDQFLFSAFKEQIHPLLDEKNGVMWDTGQQLKDRISEPVLDSVFYKEPEKEAWRKKNWYGYNLRYPGKLSEQQAKSLMQQDLAKFFGLYLNLEFSLKNVTWNQYAVLRLTVSKEEAKELLTAGLKKGGNRQGEQNDTVRHTNLPFGQHFIMRLSESLRSIPENKFSTLNIIIDETGIDKSLRCYFEFPKSMWGNPEFINNELKRYGMYLSIEKKQVPVLVVREKREQ